jgi:hypothetical protein
VGLAGGDSPTGWSWAADGRGLDSARSQSRLYARRDLGGTPRQITSGRYNHTDFRLGPRLDAFALAFASRTLSTCAVTGDLRGQPRKIWRRTLTDRRGPDGIPWFRLERAQVAYVGYDDRLYTNHIASLYPTHGRAKRRSVAREIPAKLAPCHWLVCQDSIFFSAEEKGGVNIYQLLVATGQFAWPATATSSALLMAGNGRMAAVRSSHREAPLLVTFEMGKWGEDQDPRRRQRRRAHRTDPQARRRKLLVIPRADGTQGAGLADSARRL